MKLIVVISLGLLGVAGAGAAYLQLDHQAQSRGFHIADGQRGGGDDGHGCGGDRAGDAAERCAQEKR